MAPGFGHGVGLAETMCRAVGGQKGLAERGCSEGRPKQEGAATSTPQAPPFPAPRGVGLEALTEAGIKSSFLWVVSGMGMLP